MSDSNSSWACPGRKRNTHGSSGGPRSDFPSIQDACSGASVRYNESHMTHSGVASALVERPQVYYMGACAQGAVHAPDTTPVDQEVGSSRKAESDMLQETLKIPLGMAPLSEDDGKVSEVPMMVVDLATVNCGDEPQVHGAPVPSVAAREGATNELKVAEECGLDAHVHDANNCYRCLWRREFRSERRTRAHALCQGKCGKPYPRARDMFGVELDPSTVDKAPLPDLSAVAEMEVLCNEMRCQYSLLIYQSLSSS